MNTFYFVRHAHSAWSADETRPLSEKGENDAELVAEILQEYSIGQIFSSPYHRALQTIKPLAGRLKIDIHVEPDLRERQLASSMPADFLKAVENTWANPNFAHPGGESNSSAQSRGISAISKLNQRFKGKHIVLSTHGNLLAVTLQHFSPTINFSFWRSLTFPDIYKLEFTPAGQTSIVRLWKEIE